MTTPPHNSNVMSPPVTTMSDSIVNISTDTMISETAVYSEAQGSGENVNNSSLIEPPTETTSNDEDTDICKYLLGSL